MYRRSKIQFLVLEMEEVKLRNLREERILVVKLIQSSIKKFDNGLEGLAYHNI